MTPALLVFDSATDRLAVALLANGRIGFADEPGAERASARLLPVIDRLLGESGLRRDEIGGIGFGRGPGAFTGLRAACTVAQGLALARRLPVCPIDTLAVVAEDARQRAQPSDGAAVDDVRVVQDARMGEIYAARWRYEEGRWHCLEAAALMSPDAWNEAQACSPAPWVAGSAVHVFGDRLRTGSARCDGLARPGALALAACMRQAWEAQDWVEVEAALPAYVRDKVAQTSVERAARHANRRGPDS